jgi:putative Mn2+ efflux pump MntP
MDLISTVVLSFGLAMDAFAVSISSSITLKEIKFHQSLKIAFFFGMFQAIMPLIGWLAGIGFRGLIRQLDHWIAFALLCAIGGKMIIESFRIKKRGDCDIPGANPLNIYVLLGLSVATSIDALAAGVSFGLLELNILLVITVIGSITFGLSFLGTRLGKRLGCYFSSRVEMLGGIILLVIGSKILVDHLVNKI